MCKSSKILRPTQFEANQRNLSLCLDHEKLQTYCFSLWKVQNHSKMRPSTPKGKLRQSNCFQTCWKAPPCASYTWKQWLFTFFREHRSRTIVLLLVGLLPWLATEQEQLELCYHIKIWSGSQTPFLHVAVSLKRWEEWLPCLLCTPDVSIIELSWDYYFAWLTFQLRIKFILRIIWVVGEEV